MKKFILLFLTLATLFTFAKKKPDQNKSIRAYKLDSPLIVDGKLSENLYSQKPIDDFTQKEPVQGIEASEKTYTWVSYDDANIYFSGKFYDSFPDSIDRSLMRRDNMTSSDWLWIYLDPYNDDRTGFYFAVNAGGSICDGTLYNDGWMDDSWDGIWDVETEINDEGWNVEIRIPFSQLRFRESEEMVWGVNLNRDIKRKHEMSFFVMVPKDESGFVSRFADLKGLDGVKPKQRFELLPYFVQKAQYLRGKGDDPFYKGNQYKTSIGTDLKFSIGSNINVDATINPDFGQVEVDPAMVNLSAFENYYSEKRPFFIEGANVFRFGRGGANNNWGFNFGFPNLYYSRRIGRSPQGWTTAEGRADVPNETRILGAAKLSGKLDDTWSMGVLSSVTERTFGRVMTDGNGVIENEVEPLTHYGVFRTKKEFNDSRQSLGMIFTSVNRELSDDNLKDIVLKEAYTFGVDGWTFLDDDKIYVLTGSVIGSYISGTEEALIRVQKRPYRYAQRPDNEYAPLDSGLTSMSGMYSRVMLNKQEGNWYINTALGMVTPGFEYNDLGFQYWANKINGHVVGGYRWYESDGTFRRKQVYLAFNTSTDFEGNVTRQGFFLNSNFQLENYYGFRVSSNWNWESRSISLTRGGPLAVIPQSWNININGYTDSREKIIFYPYAGYWENQFGSHSYWAGLEIEWKPEPSLTITLSPEFDFNNSRFQYVDTKEDASAVNTFGHRYIFGEISQNTFSTNLRLNWSFTPKISLQAYVQALFSVGEYENFKEMSKPESKEYMVYGTNGSEITEIDDNTYEVDPDGAGPAEKFELYNPEFNFKSLRGNLVLRWEVMPGSVFYLAWTHDKMNFDDAGRFRLNNDFRKLWRSDPNNVFLLKFSYWFDV